MKIELKDVEHLAELARIAVSDDEKKILQHDLGEILGYVSQIKEAEGEQLIVDTATRTFGEMRGELHNIMREDGDPHESGVFTDGLLAQAPAREGNRFLVKKIL